MFILSGVIGDMLVGLFSVVGLFCVVSKEYLFVLCRCD